MIYDIEKPEEEPPFLWHYPELIRTSLDSDPEMKEEIAMQVLESMNAKLPEQLLQETRGFINGMPSEVKIHCIGANLRQNEPRIRFSLTVPDLNMALDFLEHNNWVGDIQEIRTTLTPLSHLIDYYGFGLDIGNGIKPQVGIKVFVGEEEVSERIKGIAEYLTECGLCTPEKARALINWIGESPAGNSFPTISKIKRNAYLKFVFAPGEPCYVKAYNCYYSVT